MAVELRYSYVLCVICQFNLCDGDICEGGTSIVLSM